MCKCRTDCKNATIGSEDEICSNYDEDDFSDNDDEYNIKAYFTVISVSLITVYGWEQKGYRTHQLPNPHDIVIAPKSSSTIV